MSAGKREQVDSMTEPDAEKTENKMWLFESYCDEEGIEAVSEVLRRGTWWAKGPEIEMFEKKFSDLIDREYGVAFNSGTSALYAQLVCNDITDGEVIVPSFTFSATANAVVAAGAEPIFADIEDESLALSAESVRKAISEDTKAIMPIHFAGDVAADIKTLREIATKNDLLLFEDACHSPGATLDGKPAGSFGQSASFSFCFNKVITTGEGGMVVTDSKELRDKLRLLRSHGQNSDGEYVSYGHNLRMSTMTAALGVSQVEKFEYIIGRRREMANYLNNRLDDLSEVVIPEFPAARESVYQLYNLRFNDPEARDEMIGHLDKHGIPTRVTYDPVHLTQFYQGRGCTTGDLPVTEAISERILTLPFHLNLDDEELNYIASSIRSYFEI